MNKDYAGIFRNFAQNVCAGQSLLYTEICSQIAEDEHLLRIAAGSPTHQPIPNMLLAAVHFLLLKHPHPLREFYGSLTSEPRPPAEAFPIFREFCLQHEKPIGELLSTRRVQTNEVRRCGYLALAFHLIANRASQPLALIEVGSSGGLHLQWDRYAYDYGDSMRRGATESSVLIRSPIRQGDPERFTTSAPVAWRRGIDIRVIDLRNEDDSLWLQALVWPDQPARRELLLGAIDIFLSDPPPLIEGDALQILPAVIADAPADAALCVFHCHALNQFSSEDRVAFGELLAQASESREVAQLSGEWIYTPTPQLELTTWRQGDGKLEHLANVGQHGQWIDWRV